MKRFLLGLILIAQSATAIASGVDFFAAVSLSMPKASVLRLAKDAKDCDVSLVIKGFTDPYPHLKNYQKRLPIKERYGLHLIEKITKDFAFLTESGFSFEINPQRFSKFKITQVPAVVISEPSESHVVIGDVTLRYAIESVLPEVKSPKLIESLNTCLNRLGDRQ